MDDIKNTVTEGVADILEYGIDIFIENDLLKDFPFIGTVVKMAYASKTVSDKLFLSKMEKFLFHYEQVSEKEKEAMIAKLSLNDADRKRTSETLILLIDRIGDMDKPYYLACCFVAYINGKIKFDDFTRLGNAIDLGYSPDLRDFLSHPDDESCMDKLLRTGLTEISKEGVSITYSGVSPVELSTIKSELGELFLCIFKVG